MEEPEIAVPPHTQRRIAQYLLTKTTQAFVTSHSPFVIEKFEPSKTLLLMRNAGVVTARKVSDATGLKDNDYKRFSRSGLSECMLGRAAIVVEGVTELYALPVVARRMEENDPNLQPLDIAGVAFFDADGESNMPKFGKFFKALGLRTFAFYDHDYKKKRKTEQARDLKDNFEINVEHTYKGFEDLIVAEVPVDRLWSFLSGLKSNDENGNVGIPDKRPNDDEVKAIAKEALSGNKGAGWSARLFEECEFHELPTTVTKFLASVFALFPPPSTIIDDDGTSAEAEPTPVNS
jgi:putative ATP-dependent endonuclease of OLD family